MQFLKRDAVALTLSYILLHLTVFDKLEYLDSHIAVSINLSFYTEDHGVQVYSLKNGHPVCHLSLLDEGHAYADINGDGILDQVHVPANEHDHKEEHHDDPLASLLEQAGLNGTAMEEDDNDDHACFIASYSGLPAREDLFSYSALC